MYNPTMATGATTALNAERQTTLLNAIRQGATEKRSASYAGLSVEAIRQWRRKGDLALLKKAGQRTPTERKYADFVLALDKALSETTVMMQSVVTGIASLGLRQDGQAPPSIEQQRVSGQMATWWLSHRERDDYTTRQEITGKDGESVGLSSAEALAAFREIAKANPIKVEDDVDE